MCSLGLWAALWPMILCTGQAAPQGSLPPPAHYVADYADVIDTSHENELNGLLQQLEMTTGVPYIILTVQTVKGDSLSRFAKRTAVLWKLRQEGKDRGVLFVLVLHDKTYCFEVGRDLRPILTEEALGRVEEDILKPSLQAGKVSDGIYQCNLQVIQRIARQYGVTMQDSLQSSSQRLSTPQSWQEKGSRSGWYGWMVVIGIIVAAGFGWGRTVRRSMRPAFPSCGFGTWGDFGHRGSWSGGCFGGGFGPFGVGSSGFNPTQKKDFQTKEKVE
jgi:uncharacterized protein